MAFMPAMAAVGFSREVLDETVAILAEQPTGRATAQ